jgi:hypothetical protein
VIRLNVAVLKLRHHYLLAWRQNVGNEGGFNVLQRHFKESVCEEEGSRPNGADLRDESPSLTCFLSAALKDHHGGKTMCSIQDTSKVQLRF